MAKQIGIIGGGIGGMITALLLHRQGHHVTIHEQQTQLGGRLAYHERDGVRIDQGPTIVLLPEVILSILEEAGVNRQRLDLIPCDPLASIHFADGTVLRKYSDSERQVAEIERLFPGEGQHFLDYMRDLREIYTKAKPVFLERPFLQKRALFSWRVLLTLWRAKAHISVRKLAARYFRDERLRSAYSLQTLYIGGAPAATPGLYSLIPYAEQAFGIWYLKGGYAKLSQILTDELTSRGINIHLRSKITQILFENDTCCGVSVDGIRHSYDAVIYNGDYPQIQHLLPRHLDKYSSKANAFEPSSGCVLVYLLANRTWDSLTTHQFFLPADFQAQLEKMYTIKQLPRNPAYYVFQPQTIDDTVVPPGQTLLYFLIPVPTRSAMDWQQVAPNLVEQVMQDVEQRALPGLNASIVWRDIRTPQEAQQSGLYGGGSFGLAPTWKQSGMFRPQIVPLKTNGLYAVGASIHPGGGIPIVMQGAKILAQHLREEWT